MQKANFISKTKNPKTKNSQGHLSIMGKQERKYGKSGKEGDTAQERRTKDQTKCQKTYFYFGYLPLE